MLATARALLLAATSVVSAGDRAVCNSALCTVLVADIPLCLNTHTGSDFCPTPYMPHGGKVKGIVRWTPIHMSWIPQRVGAIGLGDNPT